MPPKQLRLPAATPAAKAAATAAVITAQSPPADADATADYSPELPDDEAPAADADHGVPASANAADAAHEVPDGVDAAGAAQEVPDGVDAAGAAEDDGQFSTPRRRLTARKQIASTGSLDWQVLDGFKDGSGAGSDSSSPARPPRQPVPTMRPQQFPEAPLSPVKQASEPERFDLRDQQ
jgi:hypothetical protein